MVANAGALPEPMGKKDRPNKRVKWSQDEKANGSETGRIPPLDTSRPSAIFQPTGGRKYTVSVAIAGGIISNCATLELKTALAGQIARAAAIFKVDEIVVFDESANSLKKELGSYSGHGLYEKHQGVSEPNIFLSRLLQYLETPQYLRKQLFPMHRDLRFAGQLNSLDCPHHLRQDEPSPYREGITLPHPPGLDKRKTIVDCGLPKKAVVPATIDAGMRVTLSLKQSGSETQRSSDYVQADVVSPNTPREKKGYYWGYDVRLAESLSKVFTECPFDQGYDVTIGTSERGKSLSRDLGDLGSFQHALVVIGGVAGLEPAVEADEQLDLAGANAGELFEHWINVCPRQGSRTIRAEEALFISLSRLYPYLDQQNIQ